MTLRRKENVETLPATSQKTRSPWLSRLTAFPKPSVYPAWRPPTNPVFVPLGGRPQTQHLSRLAACHEPSVYPAWRPPANPAFIPLNGRPQTQRLSRLAATRKPSVYPTWLLPANPAFVPFGSCPQTQHSSRLAVSTSTMTLRRKENVETLPATSQKTRSPCLSRLAAFRTAWRTQPTIYMMHIADGNPPDDKCLTHRNSGAIRRRNHDRYRHDGIFSYGKNDIFSPPLFLSLVILTILLILNR